MKRRSEGESEEGEMVNWLVGWFSPTFLTAFECPFENVHLNNMKASPTEDNFSVIFLIDNIDWWNGQIS